MNEDPADFTDALTNSTASGGDAADRLMPLVYDKLRSLAGRYMRGEHPGHTLQATALVHEAYIRMVDIDRVDWRGKTHFYAMAARQMRRILVDHARSSSAKKRGDRALRITLDEGVAGVESRSLELLALDEALGRLSELSRRQAQVVELRVFAGMQVKEVAEALDVSERTVKSDWRFARVWLMRELGLDEAPESGSGRE